LNCLPLNQPDGLPVNPLSTEAFTSSKQPRCRLFEEFLTAVL
jgi:hypothetical protein